MFLSKAGNRTFREKVEIRNSLSNSESNVICFSQLSPNCTALISQKAQRSQPRSNYKLLYLARILEHADWIHTKTQSKPLQQQRGVTSSHHPFLSSSFGMVSHDIQLITWPRGQESGVMCWNAGKFLLQRDTPPSAAGKPFPTRLSTCRTWQRWSLSDRFTWMTASLGWSRADKMGSSDKNSRAACLPLTWPHHDNSRWFCKFGDICWPTQECANAGSGEKRFEGFEADEWSKDRTYYTAVQFVLEFNKPLVSTPTPYSPKHDPQPTLHTVSRTHTAEPRFLASKLISCKKLKFTSRTRAVTADLERCLVVHGARTRTRLHGP